MSARSRRSLSCFPILLCTFFFLSVPEAQSTQPQPKQQQSAEQTTPVEATLLKSDPESQHAADLYNVGNFVEAMPLLEKLAAEHPED